MQLKDKTSILFWNVDTQVDFMKKLTAFAKENKVKVVNTCDYHNENSQELSDTPDFITTFPPHCMENTKGQEYVTATQPENPVIFDWNKEYSTTEINEAVENRRNIVIRKDLFDVFTGNPNADNIVKALAPEKIFVYGVATNVCVDFALMGLAKRGYKVFVIEDAIKELPNIPTPFDTWKKQGITFINTEEIAKHL